MYIKVTLGRVRHTFLVLLRYTCLFCGIVAGEFVATNNAFNIVKLNNVAIKIQRCITPVCRRQQ